MPDIYNFIKELAPIDIEYLDSSDNYYSLSSYIKGVYEDYVLVAPPQRNNQTINIPDGQEININFKTPNGLFSAFTKVISKQLGNSSGLKISFPHKSQLLERREFVRVPLTLKVEILKFLDNTGLSVETMEIQTRNISGSGLCYISDCPLQNYYDIHCKIHLEKNEEPIYARCDHLYSKKVKINNEKAYLTALSYSGISDEGVAKIVKTCFKYQIDNRNKPFISKTSYSFSWILKRKSSLLS